MITIGICDDEQKMRTGLRTCLERKLQLMGEDYTIREYDCGENLLTHCGAMDLDLLFLDIEMNALSGMDTAKLLRKQGWETVIIFVTAYPDFVFQGYEVHAFHYILKPYEEKRIASVLEQALLQCRISQPQFYLLEQKSGTRRISLHQITAFGSEGRKVSLFLKDQSDGLSFYGKLSEVQSQLPGFFLRIHNRWLVNLNFVTAVTSEGCICNERTLPISRAYRQQLEIAFAQMLLQ